jgi:MinD-like ATPase involved in chromosome partitioning or flagellar assembly
MTDDRDGQIVTFYSFKGGVGRSMALANVAALLCKAGKSVLVVDWDLEAPGLHKFFERSSPGLSQAVQSKPGILDLIAGLREERTLDWQSCIIDVAIGTHRLSLISAGRADAEYSNRLQGLQWHQLYADHDIGQLFEDIREEWKQAYDFVLLDSRTGVTDIGDVCTALLPDLLVTVFVANEQNLEGTKLIIDRARAVHGRIPRDRNKLIVVPLLGRDESNTEYELSAAWRGRISKELGFVLSDWLPKEVEPPLYFQKVFIPYYSYWSFGENLPVVEREEEIGNPTSISAAYGRVADLIVNELDWKALEKGVASSEINSLRSRASASDAKIAELETEHRVRSQRLRWAAMAGGAVLITFVGFTYLWMNVREGDRRAATVADALQKMQAQNSELAKLAESTTKLSQSLTEATRRVAELEAADKAAAEKAVAEKAAAEKAVAEKAAAEKAAAEKAAAEKAAAEKAAAEKAVAEKAVAEKAVAEKVAAEKPPGRYLVNVCGSITDTKTGLDWFVGPDENFSWPQASRWAAGLGACGGSWSLPTADQVRPLHDKTKSAGTGYLSKVDNRRYPALIDPVFAGIGSGSWIWLQGKGQGGELLAFNLNQNSPVPLPSNGGGFPVRAFAVKQGTHD